jgi:hypothetical protein
MIIVNGNAADTYASVTLPQCNSVIVRNPDPNVAHAKLYASFDGVTGVTVLPGNGPLSEVKFRMAGGTSIQLKADSNATPYELICDMGSW